MDYSNYSKEALIKRIEQLERLNLELLNENDDHLSYAWTGNLGRWYLDFSTGFVVFNKLKIESLGYTMGDIPQPTPYTFFTSLIHPDDYAQTMKSMLDNMTNVNPVYEIEYRIRAKDGTWKWYYDRGKVTQRDKNNKAIFAAGIVFDITNKKLNELKLNEEKQEFELMSLTDALTGIMNRRAILEELSQRMNHHLYNFEHLCIVMIDIDDFKTINDTYGHFVGDKVLIEVSKKIRTAIREFDTVGRYGGDEFLIILPNTDLKDAQLICERIRKSIEDIAFEDVGKLSISSGLAKFNEDSIEELIVRADSNLYKAKKSGKNRVM